MFSKFFSRSTSTTTHVDDEDAKRLKKQQAKQLKKAAMLNNKNNSEVDDSLDERSLTNDDEDDDADDNDSLVDDERYSDTNDEANLAATDDDDGDDDEDCDDEDGDNDNDSDDDDEVDTKAHKKKLKDTNDNPLLPEEMCELPTFLNSENCDKKLIEKTRTLLKSRYAKRPNNFVHSDYELMLKDDWTVSRFLLRCRQEPKRAAKLMELCGKFRREFRMGTSQPSDFPIEFHKAGGLFRYAPDRVGNQTLYMRVKMHLRNRDLCKIMKEFILCALEECDKANNGRGTAIIFDLTGCGLQNVDPSFLFWLVYSFRTYCPKGLSYIIVYNLPWILNATAKLALSWLSSTNRKRMRFVSGNAIQDFIAPENLPDFMGGSCKLNYRRVPRLSRPAVETAEQYNMTREQSQKILDNYIKFLKTVDPDVSFEVSEADHNDEMKA